MESKVVCTVVVVGDATVGKTALIRRLSSSHEKGDEEFLEVIIRWIIVIFFFTDRSLVSPLIRKSYREMRRLQPPTSREKQSLSSFNAPHISVFSRNKH